MEQPIIDKVFVVLYVDWNDETTIQGVFSSHKYAEVYFNSTPCKYRRYIEEFPLDTVVHD